MSSHGYFHTFDISLKHVPLNVGLLYTYLLTGCGLAYIRDGSACFFLYFLCSLCNLINQLDGHVESSEHRMHLFTRRRSHNNAVVVTEDCCRSFELSV